MIDLTEQFFTEIYPKYREIARSISEDNILKYKINGNCAVLSVRGKDNVRYTAHELTVCYQNQNSDHGFRLQVVQLFDFTQKSGSKLAPVCQCSLCCAWDVRVGKGPVAFRPI